MAHEVVGMRRERNKAEDIPCRIGYGTQEENAGHDKQR